MKTLEDYKSMGFTPQQLGMIESGLGRGLDVECYADPAYSADHMHYINRALSDGLDVTRLLDPTLPFESVRQIEFTLVVEDMRSHGIELTEMDIEDAHRSGLIIP